MPLCVGNDFSNGVSYVDTDIESLVALIKIWYFSIFDFLVCLNRKILKKTLSVYKKIEMCEKKKQFP